MFLASGRRKSREQRSFVRRCVLFAGLSAGTQSSARCRSPMMLTIDAWPARVGRPDDAVGRRWFAGGEGSWVWSNRREVENGGAADSVGEIGRSAFRTPTMFRGRGRKSAGEGPSDPLKTRNALPRKERPVRNLPNHGFTGVGVSAGRVGFWDSSQGLCFGPRRRRGD
jgi:hypothetical protein